MHYFTRFLEHCAIPSNIMSHSVERMIWQKLSALGFQLQASFEIEKNYLPYQTLNLQHGVKKYTAFVCYFEFFSNMNFLCKYYIGCPQILEYLCIGNKTKFCWYFFLASKIPLVFWNVFPMLWRNKTGQKF